MMPNFKIVEGNDSSVWCEVGDFTSSLWLRVDDDSLFDIHNCVFCPIGDERYYKQPASIIINVTLRPNTFGGCFKPTYPTESLRPGDFFIDCGELHLKLTGEQSFNFSNRKIENLRACTLVFYCDDMVTIVKGNLEKLNAKL